jgi:hypothetical protein
VAEGRHQQEPEGQHEKGVVHGRVPPGRVPQAPSPRACRLHQPCASGSSLSFSSSRDIVPPQRATPPTNPLLAASACEQAFSRELLLAFDAGHGSRGGALAEVFAESATLALII